MFVAKLKFFHQGSVFNFFPTLIGFVLSLHVGCTLFSVELCVRMRADGVRPVVLTVQRKMKGTTSLPLARSGSARVKELPPSTGLDVLPKEQDPVEVTLL